MSDATQVLSMVSSIATAAAGGVLFGFSTFVMPAPRRLPAPAGIAAMQAINLAAVTPLFMGLLFGAAGVGIAAIVAAVVDWHSRAGGFVIAGAALYLLGVIALTAAYHQPRNLALGNLDPEGPEAPRAWERYLRDWVRWNHVRTVAALLGAAALAIGALRS
jgi:uncharacterized membrane protein